MSFRPAIIPARRLHHAASREPPATPWQQATSSKQRLSVEYSGGTPGTVIVSPQVGIGPRLTHRDLFGTALVDRAERIAGIVEALGLDEKPLVRRGEHHRQEFATSIIAIGACSAEVRLSAALACASTRRCG